MIFFDVWILCFGANRLSYPSMAPNHNILFFRTSPWWVILWLVSLWAGDSSRALLWSHQQVTCCTTPAVLLSLWNVNRGAQRPHSFHQAQHYLFQEEKVLEEQTCHTKRTVEKLHKCWAEEVLAIRGLGRYITASVSVLCSHLAALGSGGSDLSFQAESLFCIAQFCI